VYQCAGNNGHREASIPHLSPKEATESARAAFVKAQAKQANEHDDKQDNVATEGDNNVKFGALEVEYHTSGCRRCPRCADLWIGIVQKICNIHMDDYLPARYLIPSHD